VRRFGRARRLSLGLRAADVALNLLYRGGWAAALARRAGAQGTLRVASHTFRVAAPHGAAAPPLRVAFASDFHAGPTTHPAVIAEACAALAAAEPDLLLLGGDFVSFHARYVDDLAPRLAAVPAPLGTFAVLGNHDLIADDDHIARRLEEHGVRLLTNRNVRLPPPHDHVWLCGLDDAEQGVPDAAGAFAGADGVRIVLMHSPDGLSAIGGRPFAVAFCGHTHGGQIVLPGGAAVIVPQGPLARRYRRAGVFALTRPPGARRRWADGTRAGDSVMLVSRGVGCTVLPFRRAADPEVHVCTFEWISG
jgi:predicted MPP superfamily phosphohydrolase